MAYLRIRNRYGYICKKVKKEGQWKEETIIGLGKIKNEEDKKRMEWIAKTGEESEAANEDFEDALNDLREKIKTNGKELEVKRVWEYPENNKAKEELNKPCEEFGSECLYIARLVGFWYSRDENRNEIIVTPILEALE